MYSKFDYIDSDSQLMAFSAQIASAEWISVDTEFMRERTYYAQLALIQIGSAQGCALIDVPALSNLAPLLDIFTKASCLKIMHSASQDMEVLYQALGEMPAPLFDTQIAASFLGEPDQISYGNIVEQRIGVVLDKDQTRTNWLQRPLSEAQLGYAEADVIYLHDLFEQLSVELKAIGRLDWTYAESDALAAKTLHGLASENAWQRLKSLGRLTPQQQQVARALSKWREDRAQTKDLPREWVLKKQALVGLAKFQPSSLNEMKEIEGLTDKFVQFLGKMMLNLLAEARQQDDGVDHLTQAEATSEQRKLIKQVMARLRAIGEEIKLAPSLVANRNAVEQLVLGQRDLPMLSGWRAETAGNELLALLDDLQAELGGGA
ncbi:MAG: ribonuclease D [Arenicellales bacterium]